MTGPQREEHEQKPRVRSDPSDRPDRPDRRQGAVYQGAFEAVIALLAMAGLGYWLDGYFGTAPALLLVGTALGFASFSVRLIRLGRWMKDSSSAESSEEETSE